MCRTLVSSSVVITQTLLLLAQMIDAPCTLYVKCQCEAMQSLDDVPCMSSLMMHDDA